VTRLNTYNYSIVVQAITLDEFIISMHD